VIEKRPLRTGGHTWRVRWYDYSTEKRIGRSKAFATRAAAQRFDADRRAAEARGAWVDPSAGRIVLNDVWEVWIAGRHDLAPRTVASYTSVWDTHLRTTLGGCHVGAITRAQVTARVRDVSTKRSAQMTRHVHRVLSLVLDAAVEQHLIGANVAKGVPLPRIIREQAVALDVGEVEALADAVDRRSADLVRFLAYSGARWGEAVALRRRDVARDSSSVLIARASREVNGKIGYGLPKSKQRRRVPIASALRPMIARRRDAAQDGDALIFTAPDGGPIRYSNWRRLSRWDEAAVAIGHPGLRPHVLRHTCASLLLHSGAAITDVSAVLGHSSPVVTLSIYSHIVGNGLQRATDYLDALIEAQSRSKSDQNTTTSAPDDTQHDPPSGVETWPDLQ